MRISARMEGLREVLVDDLAKVERATTAAMREAVTGLTEELKDQTYSAGLGLRVAKAWKGATYPQSGTSLTPAGYVKSKAPNIVSFFSKDSIVRAAGGRFLAIPTDDTPKGRGGARMTPQEVEQHYGRRLQFIEPGDKGFRTPSIRRGGVAFLVLKGLVVRKSSQRWRNPSARESQRGRKTSDIIMFVLVPQVVGHKKLDLDAAAEKWAGKVAGLVDQYLGDGA